MHIHDIVLVLATPCGFTCLATINVSFSILFTLMALFLGSSILTLKTGCSQTMFWCHEMICRGFAFLYGGTYFSLWRKVVVIMDEGEYYASRTMGMELLGPSGEPPSPGMIRRMNVGFNAWMGPAVSSSDDEDELVVDHKDF
ncbi:hypothetical protein KP509_01G035100 [Ceratopteris richardii]|uniref:Transmembrane protein n=1 Tax=Ceratopteris richardii TaxID=49495 RepID=A0A8T2VKF0_CERRI|nr:hypothetical protein KP509_01G035100 [Ceratopteris richardii]